ncbi:MAG: class I SAM-dependent methyltransferase [Nitrospira sp.]|nr:class I SAM-dependent methyltransferase [Nitrospira sp.]
MDEVEDLSGYLYNDAALNHSHQYLLPALLENLACLRLDPGQQRVFELGCGNGSVATALTEAGYDVTGVDPSEEGIAQANHFYPTLKLASGSAYDNLSERYGQFPVVVSLEVVEHVYFPRKYAATLYDLVEPGGVAILSTPYHGYWKNLALALTGRMDDHFTALWDYGHIKFWSFKTLRLLLEEAGFRDISFQCVGRIPILAKSMMAIARKA